MTDLTDREMQVLHHMSHGCPNGEIGRRLGLTEDTVKTHARSIFKKLGAVDRAHAVRRGFEMAFLQPYTHPNKFWTTRPAPLPETSLAEAMRLATPERQLYAALQSLGWAPPGGGAR